MRKYHIVNAEYNENTGFSLIKISTPIGSFFGDARLNPEDKEAGYDSRFFGCQLAELRAVIKYYKALVRIEKEVYKRELNFLNTFRLIFYLTYNHFLCLLLLLVLLYNLPFHIIL